MVRPLALRTPWPPKDYMEIKTVSSADNWWTLQAEYFPRRDPWDIIFYNFKTRSSDEVNWYLHEKLGCTLVTNDRANFRFGFGDPKDPSKEVPAPAGKSIKIYIPYSGWTPPNMADEILRAAVIRTLRSVGEMEVRLHDVALYVGDLRKVATKVAEGAIDVRYVPTLGDKGRYAPTAALGLPANFFAFPFPFPRNVDETATIVHEGVHAAMDIRMESLTYQQDESLAYVAGFLAILQRSGEVDRPRGPTAMADKFFEVAWDIAIAIDAGGGVTDIEADVDNLRFLLKESGQYTENPTYDGVPEV
jgi:hypothetical protein